MARTIAQYSGWMAGVALFSAAGIPAAETELEEVTITSTGTNISGVKAVGSEAVTVDRAQMQATGLASITDIVQTLSQVQSPVVEREGGNTGVNSNQGTAIGLRGLGSASTLLLVDGRRLAPTGTNTSFTEANQVPLAAIERIEIIADGASAVYGSDAIAGVVNYVLRKDFDGVEIGARHVGSSFNGETAGSALVGHTWSALGGLGGGNLMLSVEYNHRTPMVAGESPYLRADLSSLGGVDSRINGSNATPGIPGNIVVPRTTPNPTIPRAGNFNYYGLPAGTNGVGLTPASLLLNQPNILDSTNYSYYLSELKRKQAALFFNQELTPRLRLYVEAFFTSRTTETRNMPTASNLTLPASSPYYIAGIPGVTAGTALNFQYNFAKDVGYTQFANTDKTYTISTGLNYQLPKGWNWENYVTIGDGKSCGLCFTTVNNTAFQAQVTAGAINPFSTQPLSAAQIATFFGERVQRSTNKMTDFVTKANGALFGIPGGMVRAALGYEHTDMKMSFVGGQNLGATNAFTTNVPFSTTKRTVDSGFVEFHIPLVGASNSRPWMQELNLSAAARYDRYSDFGDTTNPKFGFTWVAAGGLSLRGSWSTSFRAPGLPEKSPGVTSLINQLTIVNGAGDPAIPIDNVGTGTTQALVLRGANGSLGPETADVWQVGFDWAPPSIRGLRMSATYYDIHWVEQLVYQDSGQMLANPTNRALYGAAGYIIVAPQPATCVNFNQATYNPILLPYLNGLNLTGVAPTNPCAIKVVLDARASNAAQTNQSGIDFGIDYNFATGVGDWRLDMSLTHVVNGDGNLVPGTPLFDQLDRINTVVSRYPISWKGRSGVSWRRGSWSSGLNANYVGSYTNDLPITINGVRQPIAKVPSWVTLDARLGYAIPTDATSWASALSASLVLTNLTDKDPPLVLSTVGPGGFAGGAIDAVAHNPFGRRWTVQLTKVF